MDQVTTLERTVDTHPSSVSAGANERAARRRRMLRRVGLLVVGLVVIVAGVHFGIDYWQVGRFMISTDDAYVQADNTLIAPRVSGYISQVLVEDNQPVKAGQVLARIDDRDFQTALQQATADRSTAQSEIQSIDAQLTLQQSMIDQATQQVTSADAALRFAQQDSSRYDRLQRSGAVTAQSAQQSDTVLVQRNAELLRARAVLTGAKQQVAVLQASRVKASAQLQHYQAAEQQAGLNLGYTTIVAPEDGTVGARTLRVGQYVQAGTQLMAVVPLNAVYVVANYKETQLTRVQPGQPVEISVDTYPDEQFHGRVDSISPASGLQFALLPPDNATGNFTKIVQRLPVKIVLDPDRQGRALTSILRPGMSVEPTIDTRVGDTRDGTAGDGARDRAH